MNEHYTLYSDNSYPVKIVCRTAAVSRLRKIRFSWLATATAFGLGCASAMAPASKTNDILTAIAEPIKTSGAIIANNLNLNESKILESIVGAAPEDPPLINTEVTKTSIEENRRYSKTLEIKVEKGDTLISLLTDAGVPSDEAHNSFEAIRRSFNPRRLDVGNVIAVKLGKSYDGSLIVKNLSLPVSAISTIELARTKDDDFTAKKVDAPLIKRLARAGGHIDSSIYQTGIDAGIPASMLNEMINAYSYDVDFQRDVKKGGSIDVLFERMETKNGIIAGSGNFVFSELTLGDRTLKIFRYIDKNGNADFYNEKGESVRKALLRTPISGARITSTFGMREHPISGYTKMHKGVDFGAPIGTPIYAAGDGIVETAAVKNGYGNYLRIKHNNKYSSAYAHLSRFASGVSPGKRVKQGQIVAYVGMTGATTGPHLHYEILANNEQVNPANVKFKTGNVLQGKELANFRSSMNRIEEKLASINRGKTVAMADEQEKNATN